MHVNKSIYAPSNVKVTFIYFTVLMEKKNSNLKFFKVAKKGTRFVAFFDRHRTFNYEAMKKLVSSHTNFPNHPKSFETVFLRDLRHWDIKNSVSFENRCTLSRILYMSIIIPIANTFRLLAGAGNQQLRVQTAITHILLLFVFARSTSIIIVTVYVKRKKENIFTPKLFRKNLV